MRILISAALIIINLVLQSTLFGLAAIRGITPNTMIIVIVSFAVLRGSFAGAACGFFSGLLYDIFFGTSIGLYAGLFMIAGFLCGLPHREFYKESFFLSIILTASATFGLNLSVYALGLLSGTGTNFIYCLINIILPETVYTAVLAPFLYSLIYIGNSFIEERERYKRRLF